MVTSDHPFKSDTPVHQLCHVTCVHSVASGGQTWLSKVVGKLFK